MLDSPLLSVDQLCSGYGRSQVLFGLSLEVPVKGAVCVLGRNGAGKTTLLKAIAGDLPAISGAIQFNGKRIDRFSMEKRARDGLGYVPQDDAIFSGLTVSENLRLGASFSKNDAGIEEVLSIFPKLGKRLGQAAGTLSGGERKMVAIGRAILGRPKLLMLDEPTEGVWIGVIEEIAEQLIRLSTSMSVVLVEQHIELAMKVAQTAYVMERGRVVLSGPVADVKEDPALLRFLAP
ncbi:MAG: ABC transporter ATP-binding protein [Betaproteobacteria bacterium]|nr:ABC transporter ATP-binding protein [Betaproteobacteria bacterium]